MRLRKLIEYLKMRGVICIVTVLLSVFCLVTTGSAHYIQTHQKIIDWTVQVMGGDQGNHFQKEISQFLNTKSEINNRLYLNLLKDGVRDADRLANGIESVGKDFGGLAAIAYNNGVGSIDSECDEHFDWCWDLTQECDAGQQTIMTECYEMDGWPIGDHGYDPDSGRGYNYYWLKYYHVLRGPDPSSNIDKNAPFNIDDNVALYVSDLKNYKSPEFQILMGIIQSLYDDVSTVSEAEIRYKELLKTSNASFMAQYFYERAISEWGKSNFGNAMFNLGITLHMIQDMTVPYHADPDEDVYLGVKYDNGHHMQYEADVWDIASLNQLILDDIPITLSCPNLNTCPTTLLHSNAVLAKQSVGDSSLVSIQSLLTAGVSSSAELLTSFFQAVGAALEDDTLADAEYFFDIDPGESNGISLPSADGIFNEATENINITVPVTGLLSGPHYLYIRMRNEEGIWGIPNRHLFVITNDNSITSAEYFFDVDPGVGNGTPIDTDGGEITANIGIGELDQDLHRIYIRMKDEEGSWGPARQYAFEVIGWNGDGNISQSEYFIDEDPGEGSGSQMIPSDGSFNEAEEMFFSNLKTSSLPEGEHTLYVRAQDSNGIWTLPAPFKQLSILPFSGELGDINGDGFVTLIDAILALKIISGEHPAALRSDYVSSGVDIDGASVGLTEAIYVLKEASE